MPYVNPKVVRGGLTERMTDVVVEVFARGNDEFRPNVWVVVDEVEPGQWGSGGKTVDLADVRRITGRG